MADFRSESSVGARIKLARRERGYRTTRELADAIPADNVTMAVLENIESGRKADLSISQLLNIASGLGVPVSMLLAPMANPEAELDLPNLSGQFDGMTAAEFDCWLSATPLSSYRPRLAAERGDIDLLNSLRELGTLRRELERLEVVLGVQSTSGDPDFAGSNYEVRERIARLTQEVGRVAELLASAGILRGSASAS